MRTLLCRGRQGAANIKHGRLSCAVKMKHESSWRASDSCGPGCFSREWIRLRTMAAGITGLLDFILFFIFFTIRLMMRDWRALLPSWQPACHATHEGHLGSTYGLHSCDVSFRAKGGGARRGTYLFYKIPGPVEVGKAKERVTILFAPFGTSDFESLSACPPTTDAACSLNKTRRGKNHMLVAVRFPIG